MCVKAFEDGHEMLTRAEAGYFSKSFRETEDQALRQDARLSLLTEWWCQNEALLVYLCDEASGSSAALALRKTPMAVRL